MHTVEGLENPILTDQLIFLLPTPVCLKTIEKTTPMWSVLGKLGPGRLGPGKLGPSPIWMYIINLAPHCWYSAPIEICT